MAWSGSIDRPEDPHVPRAPEAFWVTCVWGEQWEALECRSGPEIVHFGSLSSR